MTYTHLTQAERHQIKILRKAKHKQSEIAALLRRDKSCISSELRRNQGQRGYQSIQAHALAQTHKQDRANGPPVAAKTWAVVESKQKETRRPQQISGYLSDNQQPGVSHESIYQYIYADKRKGGTLHLALRCQKARKKRHTERARRTSIPNQVSIDLRPAVVAERARFGDWEAFDIPDAVTITSYQNFRTPRALVQLINLLLLTTHEVQALSAYVGVMPATNGL
jgi:IS30 family transposase